MPVNIEVLRLELKEINKALRYIHPNRILYRNNPNNPKRYWGRKIVPVSQQLYDFSKPSLRSLSRNGFKLKVTLCPYS